MCELKHIIPQRDDDASRSSQFDLEPAERLDSQLSGLGL